MESTHEKAFEAVRTDNVEGLMALLAADPSLAAARDENGVSLRLQACYQRKTDMLAMLRDAGPSVDIFEAAALPGAARRGAEMLAVDPSLAHTWSSDGFTPLHLASFFGAEEMARRLLDGGADPNAVSRNPMAVQPLHSAAASRAVGIIAMLLSHGADVNARQAGGWTPLHAAAMFGDLAMVELLVKNGAEVGRANDNGKTPLDLAVEKDHAQIANLLRGQTAGS